MASKKPQNSRSKSTANAAGESQFQALIEAALDIVVVLNYDGTFRYLSPSVQRTTGYTPVELVGENAFSHMHPDDAQEQSEVFKVIVSDPELDTVGALRSFRFRHKDGHWVVLEAVSTKLPEGPEPPGIVVNARDVTERAQAHETMRETAESERRLAQENEILAEVGRIIGSTLNIEDVFELFAAEVERLIDFDMIAASIVDHVRQTTTFRYWSGPAEYREKFQTTVPLEGSVTGKVVSSGEPVLVHGSSHEHFRKTFTHLSESLRGGVLSWLGIPLVNRGVTIGALLFFSSKPAAFSKLDIALAGRVSYQIAGAIDNARLFDGLNNAETALADSNDRNRMILETAHDAFVGIDDRGQVVAWNPQAETTFGWSAGEAMRSRIADLIIPERLAGQHLAGVKNFTDSGNGPMVNQRVELMAKHRDGHEFPVELTVSPLKLGDRHYFYAFIRDITSRREAEDALLRSEERFRAVYINAANGIGTRAIDGTPKDLNPAFLDMVGYTMEEIRELKPGVLFDTKYEEIEQRLIERALQGEDIPPYEKEYIRKDGTKVLTEVRASLERDDEGNPIGIVAVVSDITERQLLENEIAQYTKSLELAYEELQQLDRLKDEFISTVSHELRTPLTSIKGSAEILLTYNDEEKDTQMEFLRIINKECDRLTRMVTEVLDLSRMESREMIWNWADVDLEEVVAAAVDGTQSLLLQKDISINVNLAAGLPRLWNDRDRLVQVVTNLLSNSIKFTEEGGKIRIDAKRSSADELDGLGEKLEVCVSDTGIGIEQSEHQNIFQKFKQVSESVSDKPTGTGLGLPICREIVEYVGGEMWVESTLGNGSSFYFTVPVAAKEHTRRSQPEVSGSAAETT